MPSQSLHGGRPCHPFTFYLGVHNPAWLERTDVPLFISRNRLKDRKRLPRARGPWGLDSGGFTELSRHGGWMTSPETYAAEVRRYQTEIGNLAWASQMDWMCEPSMLAKTGKSIRQHQELTIANFLQLQALAPEVPWAPVLQGWTTLDYRRHLNMWAAAGVDLKAYPVVGIGSVCRRQEMLRVAMLIQDLAEEGLRVHAFGFKTLGLPSVIGSVVSSDSMAWSLNARRMRDQGGNPNSLEDALIWRSAMLGRVEREARERGNLASMPVT